MYKVLARKYRPSKLDEVVGQPVAVKILRNAITTGRLHHAILLSGPMGTGKTSLARIISKSLNCEKGPTVDPCGACEACKAISVGKDIDVIEIDGASNRKIEDARAIIESVKYPPLKRKFKIYIIDEVHMLTQEAFNALLKTIEEPPDYVKFIFATTAIEKVPDTILSRCQILNLRKIPQSEIEKKLRIICEKENIKIDDDSLALIAYASDGSLRVAEGYLDRCIAYSSAEKITKEDVSDVLGISTLDVAEKYIDCIIGKRSEDALNLLRELDNQSKNLEVFCRQVLEGVISRELPKEIKVSFLNIFYQAMINIKQKIDSLQSLNVATLKAVAVTDLDKIENIIEKLAKNDLPSMSISRYDGREEKTRDTEAPQELFSRSSPVNEEGLEKNRSGVDLLLKVFGGKIINIEKISK